MVIVISFCSPWCKKNEKNPMVVGDIIEVSTTLVVSVNSSCLASTQLR